jgi:methylmalonyl-CoA/ethylmalonyl-CoA epimerase
MTAPPNTFEITGIRQIAINVKDLARATEFYRDKLGLKLLYEFPGLAFFDCGGVRLMLSRAEAPEFDHPTSIIYYKVGDIDEAARAMKGRAVTVESEPRVIASMPDHDIWLCMIRDSESNLLGLMSEVKK